MVADFHSLLLLKVGDSVKAGDAIVIISAMKMEHTVRAPVAGIIERIHFKEGDMVDEKKQVALLKE